jgi:hypothetical protein
MSPRSQSSVTPLKPSGCACPDARARSRLCQVVEAETLIRRASAFPQSCLPFRQPAPCLQFGPVAQGCFDDTHIQAKGSFCRYPVRENPLQQLFPTQTGEEKRGFPSPIVVAAKGAFNLDNEVSREESSGAKRKQGIHAHRGWVVACLGQTRPVAPGWGRSEEERALRKTVS